MIFRGNRVRRILHQGEWWFSVVDVIGILTDSVDNGAYWRKLKQRLIEERNEPVTFCHGLKLVAADDKLREIDCTNTEGLEYLIIVYIIHYRLNYSIFIGSIIHLYVLIFIL